MTHISKDEVEKRIKLLQSALDKGKNSYVYCTETGETIEFPTEVYQSVLDKLQSAKESL
jgi:hypothetical protein